MLKILQTQEFQHLKTHIHERALKHLRNKKAIGLGAAAAGGAAAGGTVAYNLAKGKTEDNKEKQEEK